MSFPIWIWSVIGLVLVAVVMMILPRLSVKHHVEQSGTNPTLRISPQSLEMSHGAIRAPSQAYLANRVFCDACGNEVMSSAAFCDMCGRSLLEPPQTRHEPPEQPFLPPSTSAADARDIAGMTVADATGKVLGIVRNVVAVNGQGYLVIKPVTIYTSPAQSNEIQSEFMVPWNLIDSIHDVVLLKLMSEKTEPI